jgi:hypothetical protein
VGHADEIKRWLESLPPSGGCLVWVQWAMPRRRVVTRFGIIMMPVFWGIALLLRPAHELIAAAAVRDPAIDHDLVEVTIPQLEAMYASHKYTVTQVTQWYLDRIARYDSVYNAVLSVDRAGALATAAEEDAAAAQGGTAFARGA